MKFPTVSGRDTNGRQVKLPDGLDGEQTLVVVSFHQRQRSLVSSWRGFADELCDRFDHFAYYELVVVGSRGGMLPPTSSGGMSPTSARHQRHENTILLSVDKQSFRRRLGIIDEETIYAFLLEDDRVVRQEAGVLTPSTAEALESLLLAYRDEKGRSNGAASPGESSS